MLHRFTPPTIGAVGVVSNSRLERFILCPQGTVKGLKCIFFGFARKQRVVKDSVGGAKQWNRYRGNSIPESRAIGRRFIDSFSIPCHSPPLVVLTKVTWDLEVVLEVGGVIISLWRWVREEASEDSVEGLCKSVQTGML